jgi:RHS repeat-associated protein
MGADDVMGSTSEADGETPKGLAGLMPERQTQSGTIDIPQLQLPRGGGALRGIDEKFAVNSSNGTASLTIQLPLTPNRDAYTPKVDLTYSSGAGNGPFGMGWSLGFASIQRKTDTSLPRYLSEPNEDVFTITGVEDLVPNLTEQGGGDWGTNDAGANGYRVRLYRPRVSGDFSRIERITHAAHGEYWKVTDRSNTATIYGRSAGARIADPADPRRIFRWLPEFSYDNRGNWIAYEYKVENSDNIPLTSAEANRRTGLAPFTNAYAKRIRYGNHMPYYPDPSLPWDPSEPDDTEFHFEVVFDYGEHDEAVPAPGEEADQSWSYRADAFSSYRSGFEIRTARLCRRVLMFHHFPDEALGSAVLVRSLDVTYTPVPVNGAGQSTVVHLSDVEQSGYVRRSDGTYSHKSIPPLSFDYQPAEWDATVRFASPDDVVDAPIGLSPPYQFVDLYGEGIAGILTESDEAWIYKHNRGDRTGAGHVTFERGTTITPRPNASGLNQGVLTLEDLDASGEKQIVVNGPQLGGYYELGSDDLWAPFRPFPHASNIDFRDPTVRRIDLTGDGKLAIVVAEDDAFVWFASDGKKGFKAAERALRAFDEERGPAVLFAESKQTVFLADMNADGLTDIVRIRNSDIAYWPNIGYGRFGAKVAMSLAPVFDDPDNFDPTKLRLADITGNGACDIIYAGGDTVRAWLNQAGNGWSDAVPLENVPPITAGHNLQIADLMGRSTPCLVWSSNLPGNAPAPLRYVDLMGGRKPHLLTRYINNMGKETRLEYRSSTYFYLQDKEAGTPWVTRLPFPVHVVSRQIVEEHVTGARLSSSYSYHHGYWDPEEREFRGFGRVDRLDTEDYDRWMLDSADTALEQSRELFQAPTLTRTWYHVGAWDRHDRILTQFEAEYWQRAYRNTFPAAPPPHEEPGLPEARIVAAQSIADPAVMSRLSADERREALRACKSLVLRQEVFALDVPAAGATDAELKRQLVPYSVDTHSCHIQLLQPRGPNRYAAFVVVEDEALRIGYERIVDDPRIEHGLNLEIDDLGNVLLKANVVYGRTPARAASTADAFADAATDFTDYDDAAQLQTALSDALDGVQTAQKRTHILVTRTDYTNDIDTPGIWRTRAPSQVATFEITGLTAAQVLFSRDELSGVLEGTASTAIAFEAQHAGGVSRRCVELQRTIYYDEAAAGPLPLNQMASHGLIHQGQQCAFTPSLLSSLYGTQITDPDTALDDGGYVHSGSDTDWWIPAGTVRYSEPGESILDVRARFFKPLAHIDPFGAETRVRYHKDYFLFIEDTTDAVGNITRVEAFDFRLLTPVRLRDANDNLSAIVSDELALVKAQALLGKDVDGDGTAELELADNLDGLTAHSSAEAATVALLVGSDDSVAIEALARQLLQNATMRFVYDLDSWRTRGGPAVVVRIVRERHHSDGPDSPLHIAYDYTDGSGALAMVKTQAEPGVARAVTVAADETVTIVDSDTEAMTPPRLRWVGTGRTVLNNKGKPVRRYEPYFSVTPRYESLSELVATGVSAVLTYDAPGRLIRTDLPDGTFMHTKFDTWQIDTYDAGDTVFESRWHAERIGHLIDAELTAQGRDPAREIVAAVQSEAFADTPGAVLLDPLARPVLSLDHSGFDAAGRAVLFATTIVLDIEGNVRKVVDARGNTPIAYRYDMVGRRATQTSMDGGSRWTLQTVTGNPLMKWDERGHVVRYTFDAMQRPITQHVQGGDGAVPLDNMVMRAEYGEGQADDRELGLRGKLFRRWDTGGMQEWGSYDVRNNLLETTRRFAIDYRGTVDWSGDLDAPLEAEALVTRHAYDAVNRVTATVFPDGTRAENTYNPANLLEAVNTFTPGEPVEPIVTDIAYDARGQRTSIGYGNGARTKYRHDPLTFRLIGLTTVKGDGSLAQDLHFTHDCAGNLTHQEDHAIPTVFFDNSKIEAESAYTYDPLYRLIGSQGREHAGQQATGNFGPTDNWDDAPFGARHQPGDPMVWRNYSEAYDYDPDGNISRLAHTAPNGSYTRTYAYETQTNRLISTAVGPHTYLCDHHPSHGFITRMPHLPMMAYTFRDELAATAQQIVAAGTPETTYYSYDHDGVRIRKVTDQAAAAGATPARKNERLYLGAFEIHRSNAGATVGLERLTLSVMDNESRVAMIERRNAVNDGTPATVTRYQLSNHLGSSVMELDAAGRTLTYEEYHPYGTTAYQATDSTLEVAARRYRYSGMERDEESGLSHHNARYYCPWLARWTKPDPAALSDGINDYQYVSGNPIRLADPSGYDGWDRFLGGVKMVGGALEAVAGGALVIAGAATSEIGIGIPIAAAGVFVAAHGSDVTVSGARTMWNGEQVDTFTSQGLQAYAGMTRTEANLTDAGISIAGSLGSSALTRAPGVVSAVAGSADEAAAAAPTVIRAAAGTADEAAGAAQSSVSFAFKPGLPTGHNMVGVTTGGTTQWSHLVVGSLDEVSGGMSRVASSGTNATVLATKGPSSAYAAVTVPVTQAQAQAARAFVATAQSGGGAAGAYSYLGNNCTTYATSVLREAGVFAPSASTPASAFVTTALQSPAVVQPVVAAGAGTNVVVAIGVLAPENESTSEPIMSLEPAAPLSAAAQAASGAEQSYYDDASDYGVCETEGYYDTEQQVCYAY